MIACKDCVHIRRGFLKVWYCSKYPIKGNIDFYNGEKKVSYRTIDTARQDYKLCGPDGLGFEQQRK